MIMDDDDKKGQETAEEKGLPQTNIYVSGNYIQGDQITAGDVSNSEGIALGGGASANVSKGSQSAQTAGGGMPEAGLDAREVYKRIMDGFNLQEIEDLCFALTIDFEDLGGTGKSGKARELVKYMERRGRLSELGAKVREMRPGEQ
jgi:hypothetical protein